MPYNLKVILIRIDALFLNYKKLKK